MEQSFAIWQSMASAYLAAPVSLLSGHVDAGFLIPVLGMVCLVAGIVLAMRWREKQALWLVLPFLATAATPIILDAAQGILGWLGLGFAVALGAFGLVIWIGLIAANSERKLPVWLIGLSLLSFLAYCGYLSVALLWG